MPLQRITGVGTLGSGDLEVGDQFLVRDISVAAGQNAARLLSGTDLVAWLIANGISLADLGGLTQGEVDGRIATYARATPTGRIAQEQTFGNNFIGAGISGQVITFTQADGTTVPITLPGGGSTPARSSVLYAAITTTVRAPTAADFTTPATGNRAASGNQIRMDGWQGNRQLHIAIPTSEADPTSITQLGDPFNQNLLQVGIRFTKRTDAGFPLTISTDGAHNVWSTQALVASTLYEPAGTDATPTYIIA